ncbi:MULTISPECIES: class I adenylate-forming enzyme family protein [Streptomyces]|uniref:Class I adenylate-forming enzyme family protein n=1 Tax=Streptomyces lienomycini TaxID=284035 RepID=A0ABV9WNR0_9ACTN|nr:MULTISPECIES: class I adenylate-forming enzyme family protein [Streptomyces]
MEKASWWGTSLLEAGADRYPWVISRTEESRSELRSAVAGLGRAFADHGMGPGSTVLLRMRPSLTCLRVLLALWSRGAQVILVDFRSSGAEYQPLVDLLRPQYTIDSDAYTGPATGLADEVPFRVRSRPTGVPATSDACLVQFSSGSTGRPKVIGRTPQSLLAELGRHAALAELPGAGDRVLVLNSLVHTMGLVTGVLYALQAGATVVLPPAPTPSDVLETARRTGAVAIYGVPAHFELLTRTAQAPPLPALRLAVTGGERLPVDVYEEFHRRYGVPLGQVYGVTETGLLAAGLHGPRPPALGALVPGVEAKVVDQELHVRLDRSPYLLDDQPDRYADGWLRTFDRFTADDTSGELSILGRADSLVTIGGLKVDLAEVETVLRQHPAVREAVVLHHEVIEAYVGGETAPEPGELIAWCRERLSAVKIPKRFLAAPALPRNKTGKLSRDRSAIRSALCPDPGGATQ